jgi:predicted nucleic acid-binding protein
MTTSDALQGIGRLFLDTALLLRAAELRARYNLTLTDAFQVACALDADCEAFLTNDFGLKRVTEIQIIVLDALEI